MDITNLNFLKILPEITETIRECDFIAIDTELSGLMRDRTLNRFDLPEERFAKAVELSRGYFIMQFGLSCFTRSSPLHYNNRTYNFYIFPQAHGGHGDIDRTFSLQTHAIQFLTEHGFDFNKLFKHGVSYLTFQEKKTITAQLKSEIKARSKVELHTNGLPKFVPNGMLDSCLSWLRKVNKFVGERKKASKTADSDDGLDASRMSANNDDDDHDSEMTDLTDDEPVLELKDCSTNHRRATMKRVLECSQLIECIEISSKCDPDKNETYLVVGYIDKKLKEEKEKTSLMSAKGFLEILELVILNKKPLVGHNLALDLIQIINQFMEPLSNDYTSFKEICHSLFPLIYDTKFIAHLILEPDTLTNTQSRLNDLYCQLRDSKTMPKVHVDHLVEFINGQQLPHQAGYDAYMSGYCYLVLCESFIKDKRKHKFKKEEPDSKPVSLAQDCQVVSEFANKIHLSYSYDYKYYNLSGDEEEPDRDHVFYLQFPHTWSLEDIFQVFYQYGGVTASRLDKTSALCALRDRKHLDAVLQKANKHNETHSNYKIYSYDKYLQNFKPKIKKESGGDSEEVDIICDG